MGITNYYIRDNGKVDCPGNVFISSHQLKRIPIKFGVVEGYFDCSLNELTTLYGTPDEVKAEFYCEYNNLTSLYGGPKYVGGDYLCYKNNLMSLNGAPEYVGKNFDCHGNSDLSNDYLNSFDFTFVHGIAITQEVVS